MPLTKFHRKRDVLYAVYFVIHIAITLTSGAALVLPRKYLYEFQKKALEYHILQNNDMLIVSRPTWLLLFTWMEVLFQTPFFPTAAYLLSRGSKKIYIALLIYGVQATITTMACVAEISMLEQLNKATRIKLVIIYLPSLIIPLMMVLDSTKIISSWVPLRVSKEKLY